LALLFPASPTDGQVYTDATSGNKYTYKSAYGVWISSTSNQTLALSQLTDVNVTEGAGINGKALTWDNASNKWIASNAGVAIGKILALQIGSQLY
jgi:hypothetical protein